MNHRPTSFTPGWALFTMIRSHFYTVQAWKEAGWRNRKNPLPYLECYDKTKSNCVKPLWFSSGNHILITFFSCISFSFSSTLYPFHSKSKDGRRLELDNDCMDLLELLHRNSKTKNLCVKTFLNFLLTKSIKIKTNQETRTYLGYSVTVAIKIKFAEFLRGWLVNGVAFCLSIDFVQWELLLFVADTFWVRAFS